MKLSILNFLALSVFLFVSCEKGGDIDKELDEKDDTEITDDKKDDEKGDDWDKDEKDCFDFVYPISYTMPDGSEISGGPEELETAMKEWYETHDSKEEPTLNYPVEIVYPDHDEAKTINNEEEMEAAEKDCEDWDGKGDDKDEKDCFEFVYPISFTMPDGSTISGDEETVWEAMEEWYATHDSQEEATFVFPIQIVYPDHDEAKTINNAEELEEAEKDCEEGWDDDDKDCFSFVYPISFTMPDGSTISGDKETVWEALKEWYATHDSQEEATFVFPIQIVYPDNDEAVTIINEEELEEAKEGC